jgi:hypothetical protein
MNEHIVYKHWNSLSALIAIQHFSRNPSYLLAKHVVISNRFLEDARNGEFKYGAGKYGTPTWH